MNDNIKIALSGPGGSGKTTLINGLKHILGLRTIPSSMRYSLNTLGMGHLDGIYGIPRVMLQSVALAFHIKNEEKYSSFITDRTPIDFLTYFSFFTDAVINSYTDNMSCGAQDKQREEKEQMKKCLAHYENLVKNNLTKYDFVFYIPPFSNEIIQDGVRYSQNSKVEQCVRDKLLENCEKYYSDCLHEIKSQSVNDRIKEICSIIFREKPYIIFNVEREY